MKFTSPVSLSDKQFIAQSILPGESKAILTLEDGQTIHINKETESLLEKIDGARVHMDSTMLNYQVTSKTAKKNKLHGLSVKDAEKLLKILNIENCQTV